ncbi:transposase [Streptomyces kaempferi]|uniref:Transposase n=1 Tax=Streptomyces kaempferi TaxID=333725 RepID=A0ABW3XPS7_9ACTN
MCGRLPRTREKGGAATGPSLVDRRKTGSKHHLITDANGIPLKVITTAAHVNDVTQTLALVDGVPPGRSSSQAPRRPARRQGIRQQPKPQGAAPTRDPAGYLPQGPTRHAGPGQDPLRRGTDLRPAPPVQASLRTSCSRRTGLLAARAPNPVMRNSSEVRMAQDRIVGCPATPTRSRSPSPPTTTDSSAARARNVQRTFRVDADDYECLPDDVTLWSVYCG